MYGTACYGNSFIPLCIDIYSKNRCHDEWGSWPLSRHVILKISLQHLKTQELHLHISSYTIRHSFSITLVKDLLLRAVNSNNIWLLIQIILSGSKNNILAEVRIILNKSWILLFLYRSRFSADRNDHTSFRWAATI